MNSMSHPNRADGAPHDLDVRDVPKSQRHSLIFDRFNALPVGESFVLVNTHDPKHLRQEFDRDHPRTYDWDYLETGGESGRLWRVRITRRTAATGAL
jgi:uncharacterized protein (DUF2249 family)